MPVRHLNFASAPAPSGRRQTPRHTGIKRQTQLASDSVIRLCQPMLSSVIVVWLEGDPPAHTIGYAIVLFSFCILDSFAPMVLKTFSTSGHVFWVKMGWRFSYIPRSQSCEWNKRCYQPRRGLPLVLLAIKVYGQQSQRDSTRTGGHDIPHSSQRAVLCKPYIPSAPAS